MVLLVWCRSPGAPLSNCSHWHLSPCCPRLWSAHASKCGVKSRTSLSTSSLFHRFLYVRGLFWNAVMFPFVVYSVFCWYEVDFLCQFIARGNFSGFSSNFSQYILQIVYIRDCKKMSLSISFQDIPLFFQPSEGNIMTITTLAATNCHNWCAFPFR